MADYDYNIDPNGFLYSREISFTNTSESFKEDLILKLALNESNFNFDLIETYGTSLRVLHGSNTLRMWTAYWSYSYKQAVVFIKLQDIDPGQDVTLKVYWGNSSAESISNPASMNFIFYEEFNSATLDTSVWTIYNTTNPSSTTYGWSFNTTSEDAYILTKTSPMIGIDSWTIMMGFWTPWQYDGYNFDSDDFVLRLHPEGSENSFYVAPCVSNKLRHTITSSSYTNVTQDYIGFEKDCYNEAILSYYEPLDQVTFSFINRANYPDASLTVARKVEGDTRINNFRIRNKYSSGAYHTYINWLVIIDYEDSVQELDTSNLYVSYETINHADQDFMEYSPDITSTVYGHESSFGGNPYLLSLTGYDDLDNVWVSDPLATDESEIHAYLYTAWTEDITSRTYKHYDSGHVYYYNASKLSDNDIDLMGRNYFNATTANGAWAAIKFNYQENVGAFKIKATDDLNSAPKNYTFYGSNYNPALYFDRAQAIISGVFEQTSDWQSIILTNWANYKYYILKVDDTYGSENLKIQEWEIFKSLGLRQKKVVAQIRLHPAMYGDYQYGYPKEIKLEGTNDGINWDVVLPWTSTYTPFIQHIPSYGYWQRYSFTNTKGYWTYRLVCRGNWGKSNGSIIIGEWSMHEAASEIYTYRILAGSTDNIQQIWALADAGIEENARNIYITNDYLSVVTQDILVDSVELPYGYDDIAVI